MEFQIQDFSLAGNGWDISLVSKIFKQMFAKPQIRAVVQNKGGMEKNGK